MPAPTPKGTVSHAEWLAQALDMRNEGMSYQKIADAVGLSKQTVYDAIGKALEELVREPAERVRGQEVNRLDVMISALWARAKELESTDPDMQLKTIDRILKIQERRAKLLGLDAPEKVEHSGEVGEPVATPQKAREIVNELFRSIRVSDLGNAQSSGDAGQNNGGTQGGSSVA